MKLSSLSYIRTAVVSPILRIADIPYNVQQHKQIIKEAIEKGVQFLVFPELSITGYTCGDLFFQKSLLQSAEKALIELASCVPSGVYVIVGAPLRFNSKLYNCGVILEGGTIHYAVPKTYLPNYAEFYEERWFASSLELAYSDNEISLNNEEMIIGFGVGNIFKAGNISFAIEICEDVWSANPPSTNYAANGAVLIANLSASNETVGKADYRRSLVSAHSASTITAYCYASAGACESTTDTVFSGHGIIAENGKILNETDRFTFNSQIAIADIDIDLLQHERVKTSTFGKGNYQECQHIELPAILDREVNALHRQLHKFPFIPIRTSDIDKRYSEILEIQSTALAGRLKHIGLNSVVIGVSGGLDSTLALIACCKAFDKLSLDKKSIIAVTMPGFGTTHRTKNNAITLVDSLGLTLRTIPISQAVLQHFSDISHSPDDLSIVYENSQARERTQILMDIAHQHKAIVVGTGDMSELALGWCTYNGDHMSMYAINAGIPKTLVKSVIEWYASKESNEVLKEILFDIVHTPVSPELLPYDGAGEIMQKTEDIIGPYILHDFFLYYMLRFGFSPTKIITIAQYTFADKYSVQEICTWLIIFYKRFFSQQFKRSCMPDSVKVGSVSLSPRTDLRMPSDAHAHIWIQEIEDFLKHH